MRLSSAAFLCNNLYLYQSLPGSLDGATQASSSITIALTLASYIMCSIVRDDVGNCDEDHLKSNKKGLKVFYVKVSNKIGSKMLFMKRVRECISTVMVGESSLSLPL